MNMDKEQLQMIFTFVHILVAEIMAFGLIFVLFLGAFWVFE